ncbi:bifunctional helix-turn-helix transcriptional regulator/GNAT family N-acetyltransferase [Fulvivirgaceae bacterium BMA10]|uniref:Bifunctional helix-turn-helix transcriptional regulator/GNAT family N-acetyltransferase n=1 Tax=Splendidivirga corallicola TaxID=3051826 RepID=A0ABT8KXR6_9BACT|nr:bifunctional helix-turn-helix transcriptional regulator/GNAT family N-acetyltransferase [Fulvivirgaceae bacterium BMA10]
MNFYRDIGSLILGSWLKRTSEKFLAEIAGIYNRLELPFEPSWFPIFYLLKDNKDISLSEIARELDISHSAVSQMATILQKKGYINIVEGTKDARKKHVMFSTKGKKLLKEVMPVWSSMQHAVQEIWNTEQQVKMFLDQLFRFEQNLSDGSFSQKVIDIYNTAPSYDIVAIKDPQKDKKLLTLPTNGTKDFSNLDNDTKVWSARNGNEIIGAVAFKRNEITTELYLERLFIRPANRRNGIATSLINKGIKSFNETKKTTIHLKETSLELIQLLLDKGFTFKVIR